MHIYTADDVARVEYFATLKEAHTAAKDRARYDRARVVVKLADVLTNKNAIVELLRRSNGFDRRVPGEVLRVWELSTRGGLREITVEEYESI